MQTKQARAVDSSHPAGKSENTISGRAVRLIAFSHETLDSICFECEIALSSYPLFSSSIPLSWPVDYARLDGISSEFVASWLRPEICCLPSLPFFFWLFLEKKNGFRFLYQRSHLPRCLALFPELAELVSGAGSAGLGAAGTPLASSRQLSHDCI